MLGSFFIGLEKNIEKGEKLTNEMKNLIFKVAK